MNWDKERYVRVYTRDTGDWLSLSFEAQALWMLILRKLDREGYLHLGRGGRRFLATMLGHPDRTEQIDSALDELVTDGCVAIIDKGTRLFAHNFTQAQDWVATPAERQRKCRAKKRELENQKVTNGHESHASHESVTPAVPSVRPSVRPSVPAETFAGSAPADAAASAAIEPAASDAHVPAAESDAADESATPSRPPLKLAESPACAGDAAEREVFEHWRERMGKSGRAVFDAKRRRAVKAALRLFPVADLKLAIDGCALTPHNMGENERHERYDDLELICRDASHIERFIRNARDPPASRRAVRDVRRGTVHAEDYSNLQHTQGGEF